MRKFLMTIITVGVLVIFGPAAKADTNVSINLGQSSQNYSFTGITEISGIGYWYVQQGDCSASGGNTVCNLTGNYTGTTPGFTSGTYDLVTTYNGTAPFNLPLIGLSGAPTPLIGASQSTGDPNAFSFFDIEDGAVITLDLNETSGPQYVIPMFNGSIFTNGYFVNFASESCTPLPSGAPCDLIDVAAFGGITQGPVTGGANFLLSTATTPGPTTAPEPGTIGLTLAGIGFLFLMRKRPTQTIPQAV